MTVPRFTTRLTPASLDRRDEFAELEKERDRRIASGLPIDDEHPIAAIFKPRETKGARS